MSGEITSGTGIVNVDKKDDLLPRQVIMRTTHSEEQMRTKLDKREDDAGTDQSRVDIIANMIWQWPYPIEVWPFKLGIPTLGLMGAGTAFYLNKVFRDALLLDFRLRVTTYLGLMTVTGLASITSHYVGVTRPVLHNSATQCSICLQVRAAYMQGLLGLGYPMLFAPTMSYVIASAFKDRHLPKIYSKPKDVIGYTKSIFKTIKGPVKVLLGLHLVVPMGITYFEQSNFLSTVLPVVEGKATLFRNVPDRVDV